MARPKKIRSIEEEITKQEEAVAKSKEELISRINGIEREVFIYIDKIIQ